MIQVVVKRTCVTEELYSSHASLTVMSHCEMSARKLPYASTLLICSFSLYNGIKQVGSLQMEHYVQNNRSQSKAVVLNELVVPRTTLGSWSIITWSVVCYIIRIKNHLLDNNTSDGGS